MIMRNSKLKLLFAASLIVLVSAVYYLFSEAIGNPNSLFYSLVLLFSIISAIIFSPDRNILLGVKKVKIYDWVSVLGISIVIALTASPGSLAIVAALFIVFSIFLLSCMIRMRR